MKENFLEKVLRDLDYPINDKNKQLIHSILSSSSQDVEYVWSKIPSLLEKIRHVKGFLGVSNTYNKVKISFDSVIVSEEISKEFYEIIKKWSSKYNISLSFDFEKESFYIE